MAEMMALQAPDVLRKALAGIPDLESRPIRLVCYANWSYKQPQQLFILTYVLALDRPLDLVINLDGFNEVALPLAVLRDKGVASYYPSYWPDLVRQTLPIEEQNRIGRIATLLQQRRQNARFARRLGGDHLAFPAWAWSVLDRGFANALARERERAVVNSGNRPYAEAGPSDAHLPRRSYVMAIADTWARGSIQMARLSGANGIAYFHFLQPNQYVPRSKPLSEEEQANSYTPERPFSQSVRLGYPLLQRRAASLSAAGVLFEDLTPIFASNTETLYVDNCCHVAQRGSELLAAAIGRAVASELRGEGIPARARDRWRNAGHH
jgi:hypothetical protein